MRSGHVETSTTENFASGSSRIRVLRTPAIVDSEPAAYYVRFHTDYEIRRGRPAFDGSVEYFGRAVPPPVCGYNDVLSNAGRAVYNLTELRLLVHASATGSATAEFVSQDWICSIQHQQDGVVPDCSSCYPFTPGVRNYVSPIGGPRQSIRLSNQR